LDLNTTFGPSNGNPLSGPRPSIKRRCFFIARNEEFLYQQVAEGRCEDRPGVLDRMRRLLVISDKPEKPNALIDWFWSKYGINCGMMPGQIRLVVKPYPGTEPDDPNAYKVVKDKTEAGIEIANSMIYGPRETLIMASDVFAHIVGYRGDDGEIVPVEVPLPKLERMQQMTQAKLGIWVRGIGDYFSRGPVIAWDIAAGLSRLPGFDCICGVKAVVAQRTIGVYEAVDPDEVALNVLNNIAKAKKYPGGLKLIDREEDGLGHHLKSLGSLPMVQAYTQAGSPLSWSEWNGKIGWEDQIALDAAQTLAKWEIVGGFPFRAMADRLGAASGSGNGGDYRLI
jgi:hypothetical protein